MSNPVRIAFAAAAVVIVAVLAGSLIAGANPSNVGGPGMADSSPTPLATPERTRAPSSTLAPNEGSITSTEPLTPGLHVITDVVPFQVSIDMPGGWIRYSQDPPGSTGWFAFKSGSSTTDGCCWIGFTTADPPYCVRVTGVGYEEDITSVTLSGFDGVRINVRTRVDCHPNFVLDSLGVPGGRGRDNLLTLYVLDVGGEELVLYAWTNPPDVAQQEVAEQLVQSVQIERR